MTANSFILVATCLDTGHKSTICSFFLYQRQWPHVGPLVSFGVLSVNKTVR